MTPEQITAAVRRHCAESDMSISTFSEAVGQRFDLTPQTAARKISLAEQTGHMSDEWIDRLAVMLDMHAPPAASLQPGLDAYCPRCHHVQPSRADGTCLWCDAQTGGNTVPNIVDRLAGKRKERRSSNAGIPWKCSEEQLQEVRRLYLTGLSMRAACEIVQPETGYANAESMAMTMFSVFEQRGWNRRKQNEATAARNFKHGLARDPAHRRAMRRAQGYVRGVRCAGVKKNAPGAGKPCSKPALKDSDYCRGHDPRFSEEHARHCRQMRIKAGREAA